MKRLVLLFLLALGLSWSVAYAAERGTPDEAKALAVKAADYLKTNGPEKSFATFKASDGGFLDRDLYVTVQDSKGVMVFHATNPGLMGKNVSELKDVDGKPFNHEIQAVKDTAWVDYKWLNPTTKAVEPKKSYNIRVGEYIVSVGAYVQ